MTEERRSKKTDLILSNGEFAFSQDSTTGVIKVLTGPTVVNVTGQETPVVLLEERFVPVELEDASQKSPMAAQGFYIELHNPPASDNGAQPSEGSKESSPALLMGRRVNIPGPVAFSLWPRQVAKVIEGHHLRSNQYLLGRVYDEEAAKQNWKKAVLKVAAGLSGETAQTDGPQGTISELTEDDLSVGKLFVIKGTEVSFYIPPTGVEVVPDGGVDFVRDALTLERLQYCILVDENGDKDYQRGPKVVFPKPTQRFYADPKTGATSFRPTELNEKQGILVKVIAAYTEDGRDFVEGEELFITGADTPIYIPRPEHSLVRYDGRTKHFATAVPVGEARYVMNRKSGVIRTVHGPTMLLADPREEVIVRRVLEDRECALWYPDNKEAREYNGKLREMTRRRPSTRSAVTVGEVRRNKKLSRGQVRHGFGDVSSVHSDASGPVADEWSRAATFTEPRTLTLTTKYAGVPRVRVWSGHAVMVVGKQGERRVEVGPKAILLEYDETLEVLSPSGVETVYLKLIDERVNDRFIVRTRDHVIVALRVSLTLRFEDDPNLWFSTDDYVAVALGRVRRLIENVVRETTIEQLHGNPANVVRSAVGSSEDALRFAANGLSAQVELVELKIEDSEVASMLDKSRLSTIATAVELERGREELGALRTKLVLARERLEAEAEAARFSASLDLEVIARELSFSSAKAEASIAQLGKKLDEQGAMDGIADARQTAALGRQRRAAETALTYKRGEIEIELSKLKAMTDAAVARFSAAQGPLAEAITMLGNQQVLATVAEAVSAQRLFGGKNVADVVGSLFEGTRLAGVFARVNRGAFPADAEE